VYTARSWGEQRMTERWLKENDIEYDGVHFGKPVADRWIDDRAVSFTNWQDAMSVLADGGQPLDVDEALLRILREASKRWIEEIAARADLKQPILDVGPMSLSGLSSPVFQRMPDTFVDSRALFTGAGHDYKTLDLDPTAGADVSGDFFDAEKLFKKKGAFGTVLLLNSLEHMTKIWEVPRMLRHLLKKGGRAFILTPWNLRFHGPRPDCWRISDDGYRALFADLFEIESLEMIPSPNRPLSPVAITCILRSR